MQRKKIHVLRRICRGNTILSSRSMYFNFAFRQFVRFVTRFQTMGKKGRKFNSKRGGGNRVDVSLKNKSFSSVLINCSLR